MPLGIVSVEDWDKEINHNPSKDNESSRPLIRDTNLGRGSKQETPEVIRNIVGEEKVRGEVGKELAKLFGLSDASVSAYGQGMTSSNGTTSEELANHIGKVRLKVKSQAAAKLSLALDSINEDKLSKARVGELSAVARNMAAIVKDMDVDDRENKPQTQIIFVAPHMRKEEQYEVIDVSARDN